MYSATAEKAMNIILTVFNGLLYVCILTSEELFNT